MKVYQAIAYVMRDMSAEGISKDRRNQQQNYNFRGIDDVYNALSPEQQERRLNCLAQNMGKAPDLQANVMPYPQRIRKSKRSLSTLLKNTLICLCIAFHIIPQKPFLSRR